MATGAPPISRYPVPALADLPQQKQALYNWGRKSLVYVKAL